MVDKVKSEFYKHKDMKDGLLNYCKECVKKRVSVYRLKNITKIRAYDRSRGNRQGAMYVKDYRKRNPHKCKAHGILFRSLRAGKIIKPDHCSSCGTCGSVVAHHDDYSKPLEVTWLCYACHAKLHLGSVRSVHAPF